MHVAAADHYGEGDRPPDRQAQVRAGRDRVVAGRAKAVVARMARTAEIERPNCPLYNDQKLKLGLFGTNCSNGLTVSHAETTYRATWEHSLVIARRADAMGFEMLVPIARWRGFGGTTDFNCICFETYTWAAGLAAPPERILVFSNSHVPTVHPIVAAKQSLPDHPIPHRRFSFI